MIQVSVGDLARWWPVPKPQDHKYSRGVVGIDAGSSQYPGAGLLAVAGALAAGPGMVRYLGQLPADLVVSRYPSVVFAAGQMQAVVAGPGWGELGDARDRFHRLAQAGVPMVVDADALRLLPCELPEGSLLTPHAGELARMLGVGRQQVAADPIGMAQQAACRFGATVLLKGARQPVATPSGQGYLAVPGPAWTAQAGSGDVLAGACGTLLAAGLEAWQAAVLAASLQAVTASRNPGPYPPDVLAGFFPGTIGELAAGSGG